ncbi:26S proteasome regulatory subunit N2 [Nematocida sp. LUAm1]|nr:26S proteasome regulatory subunit N2 [Nematocida sp. LUAm2]KAI5178254.1 26S proteasome regulatory subunit N2 [Nematocida sp. LUAm1]
MNAIALVPIIERLLAHTDKAKIEEGINLLHQNMGAVGFLLSETLPSLSNLAYKESSPQAHLLCSMVCFYTQKYTEMIEHVVLAKDDWFASFSSHAPIMDLYFEESKNRIIRRYIEEGGEELSEFVKKLSSLESLGTCNYPILGLYIETKNLKEIEEFIRREQDVSTNESVIQFLVEGSKRERFYSQLLTIFHDIWQNNKTEHASLLFYKALCDLYIIKKDEESLKGLLEYLVPVRKEAALLLSFVLHDKCPMISQKISSFFTDKEVYSVLKGKFQSEMYQRFLTEKNQTDFSLLSDLSKAQSSKLSMNHMALSFCNGIMSGKTCNDSYLRKNLEWMKQAKNWSKFVVASSFGIIHTENEDPFEVLRHYLPMASLRDEEKDDPESGGALFALGLISVNSPEVADGFLSTFFETEIKTNRSHVLHGACLGLGLARLGTADEETINKFKEVLYTDVVTISEAAAYSIGLVSAGSLDDSLIEELLNYARDTEHEKISRAVGVGISLLFIDAASSFQESEYSERLDALLSDSNPIIRYSGALSLGTAYVGTGDLKAVRKLLSLISTNASEDVKRISVFSIGLVLSNQSMNKMSGEKVYELCTVLEPLTQSYSEYVRAAAALTLGMFLVGTGCKKSLELIEVLMYDSTPYVRQHASIGAGFLTMQINSKEDPEYRRVIEHMHSMTRRKSEGGAARFGALLGRAISESCGKNGVISIYGASGDLSVKNICGAVLFSQFWHWYPVVPFISLCMRPTLLLAVDTELNLIQDFQIEVDGPDTPYKITSILPHEAKKSHKKFKTLPLTGEVEKPKEEKKEKQPKKEKTVCLQKFHTVKNFERLTPLQQQKSSLAGMPSILFLPTRKT